MWEYKGKPMTQDEMVEIFMKEHFPKLETSTTFSIIEILLYPLLVTGLQKAKKAKIKGEKKIAFYLLGYLSARLNISAVEDLFKILQPEKPTKEKAGRKKANIGDMGAGR